MGSVENLKWVRGKHFYLTSTPSYIFLIEGWNSWNHFASRINETIIRQTADAIAASGLADAGYEYGLLLFISLMK
jgi:hypothetical protein